MSQAEPATKPGTKPEKQEENFFVFLIKLVVIVAVFRSFIFSPFNIPSESMLPRLVNGDYLLAAKWPYGYSRYSMPFSLPLIPGRILATQPKRGDVVIFKAPPTNQDDWIKRVIGLPGDTIQMKGGVLYINGNAVPKQKIEDFEIAVSPNTSCYQPRYGMSVNYETVKDGKTIRNIARPCPPITGNRASRITCSIWKPRRRTIQCPISCPKARCSLWAMTATIRRTAVSPSRWAASAMCPRAIWWAAPPS